MAFILKKSLDHGTSNPIVARLSLQILEIIQKCDIDKKKADDISTIYFDSLQRKLLRCWEIQERFIREFNSSVSSYTPPEDGAQSVSIPQISRLEEECHDFLYNAKNYLRDLIRVFNILYETEYEEASEFIKGKKKRPSVVDFSEKTFGSEDARTIFFRNTISSIEELIWSRNAVEHPGGYSGNLLINNFELESDGQIAEPVWLREKEGHVVFGPSAIRSDLNVLINNLLIFGEDVFASWADCHLENPEFFQLVQIPAEKQDPSCPKRWKIGPSNQLLARFNCQKGGQ